MSTDPTENNDFRGVEEVPGVHLWPTYSPSPELAFSHGKGSTLYSLDGQEYLDFIAGIAVNSFGHAHPELVRVLQEQAAKLWHISNLYRIPEAEVLSDRLCQHSFADRVFFTNSGTEATEAGLKAIRRYQTSKGRQEKFRIIGFSDSFHGRTMAALAAAGNKAHSEDFIPLDYGFDQVPWDDLKAVEAAITEQTAGIIVEPVQGEGGIRQASKAFLSGLRSLCDQHDLVLMYDEVQCGIGRTGTLFAYEQHGIAPDVMGLAKGLGSGFPVGACLATEAVGAAMSVGKHGSTFGGNPLAAVVANKVLDLALAPGLLPSVKKKGEYLRQKLDALVKQYPELLKGVHGIGLMIGVECTVPNSELMQKLREHKLLAGRAGSNMLRLTPPLNVENDDIDSVLAILDTVLSEWKSEP